jgi:hypothetical protein
VKACFGVLLVCALAIPAWAQPANTSLPRFEDYPVKEIYKGVPAAPKIITPAERKYRTRIREGVEKGWGVFQNGLGHGNEQNRPGPNFAGNMIVVQWGCGAPCLMMAVVGAETGNVHLPPSSVEKSFFLPLLCVGNSVSRNPKVTFRQDSRLMVIEATPDCSQIKHHSYAHYFIWQNNEWRLILRVRLQGDEL